jgi:hypothetical protein
LFHRSKKKWEPCFDQGCIGEMFPHMKPPAQDEAFGGNLRPLTATDAGEIGKQTNNAPMERSDDDLGAPSRYCNPAGFVGLHRNVKGRNEWFKSGGQREVKREIHSLDGKGYAQKGSPFR